MTAAGSGSAAAIGKPAHELSVREATQALAAGALTSAAYVEALLDWQRRWQVLNAYTQQDPDAARAAARRASTITSPIAGLPIAVKDNIDVAGYATTAGTPALRRHMPRSSAPLVQSLLDRGVVVMGKVGLHEMAAGGTCGNITFGQVRNPYDPAMVPGGSSGGSAAAVAARMVPAALGTDTAGSIRAPAAYSGCVGFKPTTGRYSRVGLVPGDVRRDTIGWFARSCEDIELLDAACVAQAASAGPVALAGLRLGVPCAYFYEAMQPELAAVVEAALERLRGAGVVLVEADIPDLGRLMSQLSPVGSDLAGGLRLYIAESGAQVTPQEIVQSIADPQLRQGMLAALAAQAGAPPASGPPPGDAVKRAYADYFAAQGVEAAIFPTSPEVAYPVPADMAAGGTGTIAMIRNTLPGAHAGTPGLSIPAGLTASGLPVGLELDAPAGADRRLLAIGRAIEAVLPPLPPPPVPA